MRRSSWWLGLWLAMGGALATACGRSSAEALLPPVPAQATCKVKGVQRAPWIVTLPAENSVDLDTRLGDGGLVAVRYRGCEMDVLTRCKIPGSYRWKAASLASNTLMVESSDELYAKMPIGAMSFEGHLARGQALRVAFTLSGRWSADRPTVGWDELKKLGDECASATHLVVGAVGGAYDFESVAKAGVGGGGPLAGGQSSAQRAILTSRGKPEACSKGAADEKAPPHNCGAPLKIELAEVACPASMHFVQEQGCVGGTGTDGAGKAVIVNGPREELAFATMALDATRALYNAARGKTVPPEWTSEALTRSVPRVKSKMDALGPSAPVASAIFLGFLGKEAAGTQVAVNVGAILFPDSRMRWAGFTFKPLSEHPPVGVAFPALDPIKDRVMKQLSSPGCTVEALERSDVDTLPLSAKLRSAMSESLVNDERSKKDACARLAGVSGPWRAGILQLGMLVASDNVLALVSADVSVVNDRPVLGSMRYTPLRGDADDPSR